MKFLVEKALKMKRVPILNVFTMFLSESLNSKDVEKILNTLALLNALVLSLVITLCSSVDYAEFEKADLRVAKDPDYCWQAQSRYGACELTGLALSRQFHECAIYSVISLSLSLISSVYIIVVLGITAGEDDEKFEHKVTFWIDWFRIPILFCVLASINGIVFFFATFKFLLSIKFPDVKMVNGEIVFAGGLENSQEAQYAGISLILATALLALLTSFALYVEGEKPKGQPTSASEHNKADKSEGILSKELEEEIKVISEALRKIRSERKPKDTNV